MTHLAIVNGEQIDIDKLLKSIDSQFKTIGKATSVFKRQSFDYSLTCGKALVKIRDFWSTIKKDYKNLPIESQGKELDLTSVQDFFEFLYLEGFIPFKYSAISKLLRIGRESELFEKVSKEDIDRLGFHDKNNVDKFLAERKKAKKDGVELTIENYEPEENEPAQSTEKAVSFSYFQEKRKITVKYFSSERTKQDAKVALLNLLYQELGKQALKDTAKESEKVAQALKNAIAS